MGTATGDPGGWRDPAQRVVVTGMGAMTPLGCSVAKLWAGASSGCSGIGRIAQFNPEGYPTQIAGEVSDFDPKRYMDAKDARRMSRASQFAVAAAREALADAGLDAADLPEEAGVLLGTGNSSFPDLDAAARTMVEKGGMRISPFAMAAVLPSMSAGQIAIHLGLRGYNSTVSTACAAGTQAIGEAVEVLRRGHAEVVLTGGTEAPVCELGLAGFCVMRALSTLNEEPERASRPFDARRDGFVAGEGGAVLVLETLARARARGAGSLRDDQPLRHMYAEFSELGDYERYVEDTTHRSAQQSAERVRLLLDRGTHRLPVQEAPVA